MGPLQVRLVGEVRSTQEELWSKRTWLQPGAGVAARWQTAGVGRGGKTWQSPDGGVYLSALVGGGLPAADADVIGEAAALAVLRTAREFLKGEKLYAKWPNDVVTWGKGRTVGKLAGVIVRTEVAGDHLERACVGVGLNVAEVAEELDLATPGVSAVSLEGLARRAKIAWSVPRTKVVEWLVGWLGAELAKVREGPEAVRKEFAREVARAPLLARVEGVREQFRPLSVERGGALAVRRHSGKRATVSLENSERLEWTIAPKPAVKRAPKRPAKSPPATSKRGGAAPDGRPRSNRGRSAQRAPRRRRTRR